MVSTVLIAIIKFCIVSSEKKKIFCQFTTYTCSVDSLRVKSFFSFFGTFGFSLSVQMFCCSPPISSACKIIKRYKRLVRIKFEDGMCTTS